MAESGDGMIAVGSVVARLTGVQAAYRMPVESLPVLKGIDLTLHAGRSAALIGPSGAGKTTLLRVLGARRAADAGRVILLGHDVTALQSDDLARLRRAIGVVDQAGRLIGDLSVLDNILLAAFWTRNRPEVRARAADLMERLDLGPLAARRAGHLSGGERQRLTVARALLGRPSLLLADEPASQQDSTRADTILRLLMEQVAEGSALLIATHDLERAARTDDLFRLVDGRLTRMQAGHPDTPEGADARNWTIELQPPAPPEPASPAADRSGARADRDRGAPMTSRIDPWTLLASLAAALALLALAWGAWVYLDRKARDMEIAAQSRLLASEQRAALAETDWPQFLHDPQHSALSPTRRLPAGLRDWTFASPGPVIAAPVVARGTLFFSGTDGYLHALDASGGRERWRFSLGGELVNSTPAVAGGTVFVAASGDSFFAVDARSGRPRWSAVLGEKPAAPPTVAGGLVLVASGSSTLRALDVRTGRQRWIAHPPVRRGFAFPTIGAPTVRDGVVYEPFGAGDTFIALRLRDGSIDWQAGPVDDRLTGGPAADGHALYYATWAGTVLALDRERHTLLWRIRFPGTRNQGVEAAPVLAGHLLLVPNYDGNLYALDENSGTAVWRVHTGGPLLASPAVGSDVAYQPSSDGYLYAIDRRTGSIRLRIRVGESRSSPALAGGRLYVGSLGERALIAIR